MFVEQGSSNLKGSVAELQVAAAATELGVPVLRPVTERGRYDLVFDLGGRFLRVQCKWAALAGEVIRVRLSGYRIGSRGRVKTLYEPGEIDAVAAYCGGNRRCYLLPAALVVGRHMLHLRLGRPKNGQRAALHWAADYDLPGAVAQLEEHLHGMQGVGGSSPPSSTHPSTDVVPAHQFRNRFGLYMERAAAGEHIHISRHGRPFARLLPPEGPAEGGA